MPGDFFAVDHAHTTWRNKKGKKNFSKGEKPLINPWTSEEREWERLRRQEPAARKYELIILFVGLENPGTPGFFHFLPFAPSQA